MAKKAKKIEYVPIGSFLKRAEGGPGVSGKIYVLKRAGIRARSVHSIYVGHVGLEIERGKLGAARKALGVGPGRYDWF
jgi:hypothetical protein